MHTINTQATGPTPKRVISLKPAPELARRIDVTAAMRGSTAPELIMGLLEAELPHYDPVALPTSEEGTR